MAIVAFKPQTTKRFRYRFCGPLAGPSPEPAIRAFAKGGRSVDHGFAIPDEVAVHRLVETMPKVPLSLGPGTGGLLPGQGS